MLVQLAPILEGEVDHQEPRGGEALIEPLSRVDVSRGDDKPGEIVQARIVTDQEKSRGFGLPYQLENGFRIGIVQPILPSDWRRCAKSRRRELPAFPGAPRRRDDDKVRDEAVMSHIEADPRRLLASTRRESTIEVAPARGRLFCLSMAQQ